MSRPVDFIVPDAGPIISLAHANRLDLLHVFNRPIKVLDVVKFECLKKPDSPDHRVLTDWFARKANMIEVVPTRYRRLYEEALDDERSGRDPTATKGMGDATLVWFLQNLGRYADKDAVPLILIEDRPLKAELLGDGVAHILSTRSWLTALEIADVIDSASDVLAEMGRHGRRVSSMQVDRPAEAATGPSQWAQSLHGRGGKRGIDG